MSERLESSPEMEKGVWERDEEWLNRVKAEIPGLIGDIFEQNGSRCMSGVELATLLVNHPRAKEGQARFDGWASDPVARKWYQATPPSVILDALSHLPNQSLEKMTSSFEFLLETNPNMKRVV